MFPPLHAADVGISVDSAADVAKVMVDIVLLEQDLGVVRAGVMEATAHDRQHRQIHPDGEQRQSSAISSVWC